MPEALNPNLPLPLEFFEAIRAAEQAAAAPSVQAAPPPEPQPQQPKPTPQPRPDPIPKPHSNGRHLPYVLTPGAHTDSAGEYHEIGVDDFVKDATSRYPTMPHKIYRMGIVPGEVVGTPGELTFRPATNAGIRILTDEHMRICRWAKGGKSKDAEQQLFFCPASSDQASLLIDHLGRSNLVPEIKLLVNYPVYGRGWRRVDQGWNRHLGIWYDEPEQLGGITPERDQEFIAMTLDDLLIDFPWANEASRQNFIGCLLTPIVRPAIEYGNTPMHLIMASKERTGKSKLAGNVLGMIVLGRYTPPLQIATNEDEQSKAIISALIKGTTIVNLDNIRNFLDSPSLASLLTSPTYSGRFLGKSEMLELPNNLCLVGTGNNIRATGELVKRSVPINLQPRQENPELRTDFQHSNLDTYLVEHRVKIMSCLLGMIENWLASGQPQSGIPLGGFDAWAGAVGGILKVQGYTSWLGNYNEWCRQADTDGADLRSFVTAWAANKPDVKSTSLELTKMAEEMGVFPGCMTFAKDTGKSQSFSRKVLNKYLNCPVGEWIIKSSGSGSMSLYYLEKNK